MLVTKLNFFKHLFITQSILLLVSCAGIKQENVSHLIQTNKSKTFKIVRVDESGNEINNRLILEALQQNISKLSFYPSFYSAIDDLNKNVSGFEAIITKNNSIKVQYLNGELSSSGRHNLTKATATFKVNIENDKYGLYKTVTIHSPKSLHISQAKKQFNRINTLDSPQKLQEDVEQIFKNLELSMERLIFISGEIIVRNSDDEVFDNFEHKLGFYSKNSFQEKGMIFGIFELKSETRKDIIPLRIRIFPDNNGSRIKYEFDVKYSIKADGTTTYDENEINYLIITIKNISTTKDLDAPINHKKVNNENLIAIIDDPVLISNTTQAIISPAPIDIHKTSITYQPPLTLKSIEPSKAISTKKTKKITSKKQLTKKPKKKKKVSDFKSNKIVKSPKIEVLDSKLSKSTSTPIKQKFDNEDKSSNIKNIEYIEKMLSSLKERRPSK